MPKEKILAVRPEFDPALPRKRLSEFSKNDWKRYGKALLAVRTHLGLTQEQVAVLVKAEHDHVYRLEKGRPLLRPVLARVEQWLAKHAR